MKLLRCSIVIPARNEGERILTLLGKLKENLKFPFECLVVVDSHNDSTCKYVQKFSSEDKKFKLLVNTTRASAAAAIKFGMNEAKSEILVVMMADGSDDTSDVPGLVSLIERGVSVAAASRYMAGGQQIGAPALKSFLSRMAGKSLYKFRRVGTRDATNSFKAYSKNFLNKISIESEDGFELALELVSKAKFLNEPVAELPTIWIERSFGESNFKLWRWIPKYLKWYFYAFKPRWVK